VKAKDNFYTAGRALSSRDSKCMGKTSNHQVPLIESATSNRLMTNDGETTGPSSKFTLAITQPVVKKQ